MRFHLSTEQEDGMTLLHLRGEVDLAARDSLRTAIAESLGPDSTDGLAIDLADVTFIDCSAIGTLVYGQNLAAERGLGYRIQGAHGLTQSLLRITGVLATEERS